MPARSPFDGKEPWQQARFVLFGYSLTGPSVCVPPGTVYTNTLTIDDGYHPPFMRSARVVVEPGPTPVATCTPVATPTPKHAKADDDAISHGDIDASRTPALPVAVPAAVAIPAGLPAGSTGCQQPGSASQICYKP